MEHWCSKNPQFIKKTRLILKINPPIYQLHSDFTKNPRFIYKISDKSLINPESVGQPISYDSRFLQPRMEDIVVSDPHRGNFHVGSNKYLTYNTLDYQQTAGESYLCT